jgi:signal peptidase I
MLPTLAARGDLILVERISTKLNSIRTGDVVVSLNPWDLAGKNNETNLIIKRCLATGGQKLPISDNLFTKLIGKDLLSRFQTPIPQNTLWLEGDNTRVSLDSRCMGPVPLSLVKGRAICTIYPRFKLLIGQDLRKQ